MANSSSLKAFSKCDLHLHLEGTTTPPTLLTLMARHGIDPQSPLEVKGRSFIGPQIPTDGTPFSYQNFREFIALYLKVVDAIRDPEDLVMLARSYLESAREQNISGSEIYFTPSNFRFLGRDPETLIEGLVAAQELAQRDFHHSLRWIFDIVRNSETNGEATIDFAIHARSRGVDLSAIGLSGLEAEFPSRPFRAAFDRARAEGFSILAHAGEGAGAESIWETLDQIRPDRIGHGIRALEDPKLVAHLREKQIPLEVSPWSNIALGNATADSHPIAELINAGLNIVICSDDPGLFGKTLTDNYEYAFSRGLSLEQLKHCAAIGVSLMSKRDTTSHKE